MSSDFKLMEETPKLLTHKRAITLKVGKQELWFMCSACHLMVSTWPHVYGGNGHFQYSKGNNSKSRTRGPKGPEPLT